MLHFHLSFVLAEESSMACSTSIQLHSLSLISPRKHRTPHSPLSSPKTQSLSSFYSNCTNRTLKPLSTRKLSLGSTSRLTAEADVTEQNLTLRQLCEGHVPEHVLRRPVSSSLHFRFFPAILLRSCFWLLGKL